MSARLVFVIALLFLVVCLAGSTSVTAAPVADPPIGSPDAPAAIGTSFTHQGRLVLNGDVVSGTVDFQFALYDALSGGAQIGSTLTRSDITVTNGLFVVSLDFGASALTGNPGIIPDRDVARLHDLGVDLVIPGYGVPDREIAERIRAIAPKHLFRHC